jgi:hypothetical protein
VGDGLEEKIRMSPIPLQLDSRIFRTSLEDFFLSLATFAGFYTLIFIVIGDIF